MVWFFEHGGRSLEIETRYDGATGEYLLVRREAAGGPHVERFADVITFRQRLETLEAQLEAEGWVSRGPLILRDGWKIG